MAQNLLPAEASVTNWEISESAECLLQLERVYSSTCRTNSIKYGANVINNPYSFDDYTWIFIRIKKSHFCNPKIILLFYKLSSSGNPILWSLQVLREMI